MSTDVQTLARAGSLHRKGRLAEAEVLYRELLARTPEHPHALHRLGVLAQQSGDTKTAETLLRRALAADSGEASFHLSLAVLLEGLGRLEEALTCAQKGLALRPEEFAVHYRLGIIYHRLGELEQALSAYRRAAALRDGDYKLLVRMGGVLNALGQGEQAMELYRKAIAVDPQAPDAHGNLGNVLAGMQRFDEAKEAYARCIQRAPGSAMPYANLGSCLLREGDFDGARRAYGQCLERRPGDITALAMRAALFNESGEAERRDAIADFDRFLVCEEIAHPEGYPSVQAFNEALGEQVLAEPSLAYEPGSHTTVKGEQTGSLLRTPAAVIATLRELVSTHVATGLKRMTESSDGSFRRPAPERWTLDMWATVTRGEGYQVPHIHPAGWMSGVYYVACPEVAQDTQRRGWIEFGAPPDEFPFNRPPVTRSLAPRPGLLVLFPSYFYHRTLPLGQDALRISIAFDIVPR